MNTKKIWLSSPHLGGSEQKFVQEAFDTNWIAPLGSNVDGFEMDLESYLEKEIHVFLNEEQYGKLELEGKLVKLDNKGIYIKNKENDEFTQFLKTRLLS